MIVPIFCMRRVTLIVGSRFHGVYGEEAATEPRVAHGDAAVSRILETAPAAAKAAAAARNSLVE